MAGKIFINYRRGDDPGFAGRLFDRLEEAFTADKIFIDIVDIEPGLDFVRVLEDQVDGCDVLLAVIGPNWLAAKDETGARRLDNPNDFVRIEIESGLKLGKRIIPVLVNKAEMPRAEHLPESLQPLSRRNAVSLTHERFRTEAQALIKQLEKALADAEAARQAVATAEAEASKQRAEAEAAKVAEVARQEKEKARLDAIAGLSAEQITKAEELANWDFIKESKDETDYRDHLARFPQGVTLRMARTRLETILWAKLGFNPTVEALEAFLAEFPDGARAAEAAKTLAKLKAKPETPRAARTTARKKAESATPTALKAEPELERTEEPAPARTRKRLIGLITFAAFYGLVVLTPSTAAFGWPGFIVALLAGAAVLWWLFAPARSPEGATLVRPEVTAANEELSWLSWAYAALAVSPLLYIFVHVANEADIFDHFDLMLYLSLAALVAALALALVRRQTLNGAEIGLYWLGGALGAAFAIFAVSAKAGWSYFGNDRGLAFGLILAGVVGSAAVLAYWRRGRSSRLELAFYWLGCALWLGVTTQFWFSSHTWNLPNAPDAYFGVRSAGLLFALAISAATALALLRHGEPSSSRGSEVGVYWLGCILLALPALSWMFVAYQWNWYSTFGTSYQFAGGSLLAFILAALSAGLLAYLRLPVLKAMEAACYWSGLTIAAMFSAAQAGSLVTPGWDTSGNNGWTSGNSMVLAVALTAAAALAYWWWQRTRAVAAYQLSGASTAEIVQPRLRASGKAAEAGSREDVEEADRTPELAWPAWAYAAFAVVPLLYASVLYATELGTFEPLLTNLFYLCLAAVIAGPALALAQLRKLSGAEVGLYWLGAALGGALAVMLNAYQIGWTWTFPSSEQGGFAVLLALIALTAAGIAYLRRDRLSRVEVSLYWLGFVVWGALTLRSLYTYADWRLFTAVDTYAASRASGLLLALAIAVASALALFFYRSGSARGSEVGVYWLGCVLIVLLFMPWLFDAHDQNWYGESNVTNQLASGFVTAFIVAAISAAVLVYLRGRALRAFEIGCYWAGLTIAALSAFALNIYTGAVWTTRELLILFIALSAAAAIAYWWNRPTLGGADYSGVAVWRRPEARVGLIIAGLALMLILIFWLFASAPAPT